MKTKPHKRRRWLWIVLGFLTTLFIATAIGANYLWNNIQTNNPTSPKNQERPANPATDPVTVLLLGVDKRPNNPGRADAIHLIHLDPRGKTVKMLAFPRDSYVEVPSHGTTKINHSYAYGGSPLVTKTVGNLLDIPIDGYIEVNMEGFRAIVDQLGGITVDTPFDFQFGGHEFHRGPMHLDGKQTLDFVRMRKADREGDIGRIKRGQIALKGIYHKALSLENAHLTPALLLELSHHIKTDLPLTQLYNLYGTYIQTKENLHIQPLHLTGKSARINGASVQQIDPEELKKIRDTLTENQ
ncbi:LCP family protein [Pasteuria penetrans]|uniref:LCP family protein n=1 Tax=Pasteuria penetrans TaxID=86005 RepID=UPI000FBBE260|nr:LCP family protein [Pasteuria penetrans]